MFGAPLKFEVPGVGELEGFGIDTIIGAMAAAIAIFVLIVIHVLLVQKRSVPDIVRAFLATGFLFILLGLLPEIFSIDDDTDLFLFVAKSYINLILPLTIVFSVVKISMEDGLSSRMMSMAATVTMLCATILTLGPLLLLGTEHSIPVVKAFHGMFHVAGGAVSVGIIRSRHVEMREKVSSEVGKRYLFIIWFLMFYTAVFGASDIVLALELGGLLDAAALGGLILPILVRNLGLFVMSLGFGYWLLFRRALDDLDERYLEVSHRFETLMRFAGDGYILMDKRGRIEGTNRSFLSFCGRSKSQVVGRPFLNMVSKGHRKKVRRAEERALKGQSVSKLEYEIAPSGSDAMAVASSFTPLKDQKGDLQGLLVVVWDMSVHKQLQEEREMRSKVESRDSVRRVLTNLLPVLLMGGQAQAKTMYTKLVMDSFEKAFDMDKAVLGNPDNVPEYLCMTMNGIGADFNWVESKIDEHRERVRFENTRCPWGDDAIKNPFMCQLCLGIFSRAFGKLRPPGQVSLMKTKAKGDQICLVNVTVNRRKTVLDDEE
jgi:PAS domain S-box-containing protein